MAKRENALKINAPHQHGPCSYYTSYKADMKVISRLYHFSCKPKRTAESVLLELPSPYQSCGYCTCKWWKVSLVCDGKEQNRSISFRKHVSSFIVRRADVHPNHWFGKCSIEEYEPEERHRYSNGTPIFLCMPPVTRACRIPFREAGSKHCRTLLLPTCYIMRGKQLSGTVEACIGSFVVDTKDHVNRPRALATRS